MHKPPHSATTIAPLTIVYQVQQINPTSTEHLHHHSSKHMITIFTTNNIHLHNKQKQSHYNNTHHCTYSIMQTTNHCTSSTMQNKNKPHLEKTILFKIKSSYCCFLYFIW